MHQIRVQAARRGHAILGDAQYGSGVPFGEPQEDVRLQPIALHARLLSFTLPITQEQVTFTAPMSAAWSNLEIDAQNAECDQ
jgi:23S rRNA pseudouridine1911/1915/1917 synthase